VTVPRLSAGVITADLTKLGVELEILRGKAAWAHVDVMDGRFCPQLTVGPAFITAVASTGIGVDAHLMVEEPRRLVPDVAAAGAAVITVHAEADRHLHRTLQEMTQLAGQPPSFLRGVAINPGTPVGGRAGARAGRPGSGTCGRSRLVRPGSGRQYPPPGGRGP
jgi:ribulose-phosphate 3-epimerase